MQQGQNNFNHNQEEADIITSIISARIALSMETFEAYREKAERLMVSGFDLQNAIFNVTAIVEERFEETGDISMLKDLDAFLTKHTKSGGDEATFVQDGWNYLREFVSKWDIPLVINRD